MKIEISNISRIVAVASVAALLFSSCQSGLDGVSSSDDNVLRLLPSVEAQADGKTKGAMIEGSTFGTSRTFKASAWNGSVKQFDYTEFKAFTHAAGSKHTYWSAYSGATPVEYFWNSGQTKTIFAYSNLPASGASMSVTSSAQTLTYTVPAAAADQSDILLAYYQGTGYAKTKDPGDTYDYVGRCADLNFKHPLAALVFKKGSFEDWTTSDVIKSISVAGVYASGTCAANSTFSWTPGSGTITVSMSSATALPIASNIIGETFFLIPQNFATKNVTVTVAFTIGGVDKTASCTLNQWEIHQGKYFTLEVGYSPSNTFGGLTLSAIDWKPEKGAGDKDYFDTVFND